MSRFDELANDNKIIDHDNRARTDKLAQKLARLKNVAVDIEEETRDHIPMLDQVDDGHDRTSYALGNSQARVLRLLRSNKNGRQLFCYTVIITFVLLFLLITWLKSG